jgi:hypothetical protein
MLFSVSTFSMEMGSVDSLLSVLPIGSYTGIDDAGAFCSIEVDEVNFPMKSLVVTASNQNASIFKTINDGSEFLFRVYNKEFIQVDRQYVDSTRSSYIERIIRTVIAGDKKLYVVVANELTMNRSSSVEIIDCVINL